MLGNRGQGFIQLFDPVPRPPGSSSVYSKWSASPASPSMSCRAQNGFDGLRFAGEDCSMKPTDQRHGSSFSFRFCSLAACAYLKPQQSTPLEVF
jgi:hypothetical protein